MILKKFKKKEKVTKATETESNPKKLSSSLSHSFGNFFKSFLLIIILSGIAAMTVGSFLLVKIIADAPSLDISRIHPTGSTVALDMNGDLLADFGTQRQDWVNFDEISPVMIDAIVAVEDSRFFEHHGVDWNRFLAATRSNVTNLLGLTNSLTQGGSTITQQLIKQTHFDGEDKFIRKIQEIYLAMQLERKLSKEQILEAYLNYSPFGGNIMGIQAAAEHYFGTNASDLTLAEAAALAGLVQSPNGWRPDHFADSTENRRDIVLRLMVTHGYITEDMATLAAAQPITDKLVLQDVAATDRQSYQAFLNAVIDEVRDRFELDPFDGLEIHTTMDPEAQAFVHELQNGDMLNWPPNMRSGIVFMETQTGRVRAIGGGASEAERTFNWATQAARQTGSTAKTIFSYGAAIEYLGWGSGTILNDELYAFDSGQIVNNHNRQLHGRMTIREAFNWSWNVPAVKAHKQMLDQKGVDVIGDFASRLGINLPADQLAQEAIPLGTFDATPLQMAAAYAAFGNGGVFNEPMFVEKIVKADGTVIYGEDVQHSDIAMSEETAYIMTDMLRSVMTHGTGTSANVPNMFLTGKTGTTNVAADVRQRLGMPDDAMRDSWMIGSSMDYTTAIWTGFEFDTNPETGQAQFISSHTQSFSWNAFNRVMANLNTSGMARPERPSTVVQATVETISGEDGTALLASTSTPSDFTSTELFVRGTQPTTQSTRFQQLPTPQNFTGDINGTNLQFSWDAVEGHTMSLASAQSAFNNARSMRLGAGRYITAALRNLQPSEAEARMMIRQIEAIGETVYTVYALTTSGNTVAIGEPTTDTSISINVSYGQLAQFSGFFVRASFANHGALASERSNVIDNEFSSMEIEVPDMTNWRREMVENWASENGVTVVFEEESSEDIQAGLVIRTSPHGTINVGEILTVVLSSGIGEPDLMEPDTEEPVIPEPDIEEPVIPEPDIEEPVIPEPDIEEPEEIPAESDQEPQTDSNNQANENRQRIIDDNGFPLLSVFRRFTAYLIN